MQGGATSTGNGESIYGPKFEDENFELKHSRKGMLSMDNSGPNSNGSQFFLITNQATHLDGKHVVFGKVIKGLGVVRSIECVETVDDYYPIADVVITDCGEIPDEADDGTINYFKDGDLYPDWPIDLSPKPNNVSWTIAAVDSIKVLGNEWYKVVFYYVLPLFHIVILEVKYFKLIVILATSLHFFLIYSACIPKKSLDLLNNIFSPHTFNEVYP